MVSELLSGQVGPWSVLCRTNSVTIVGMFDVWNDTYVVVDVIGRGYGEIPLGFPLRDSDSLILLFQNW